MGTQREPHLVAGRLFTPLVRHIALPATENKKKTSGDSIGGCEEGLEYIGVFARVHKGSYQGVVQGRVQFSFLFCLISIILVCGLAVQVLEVSYY